MENRKYLAVVQLCDGEYNLSGDNDDTFSLEEIDSAIEYVNMLNDSEKLSVEFGEINEEERIYYKVYEVTETYKEII